MGAKPKGPCRGDFIIPNLLTLEVFAAVVADFAGAED